MKEKRFEWAIKIQLVGYDRLEWIC